MAGHSKFKNIQHRKGAQDKKRAKLFTRLVKEIITAAKTGGGADPTSNPKLRNAVATARSHNLPKERIDKALSQAADPSAGEGYSDIRYEGFGVGGVAIIVEALTDNKNRTAAEVRSVFSKFGGNLGETGSVSFMFDHIGIIQYPQKIASMDQMLESAIEAGADDAVMDEDIHIIYTHIESFAKCLEFLSNKYGQPEDSKLVWIPNNCLKITDEDKAGKVMKLIEALEDLDDVQEVFSNCDIEEK